jgi:hypothetical protein
MAAMAVSDPDTGKRICHFCSLLVDAESLLRDNKIKVEALISSSLSELLAAGGTALHNYAADCILVGMPSCSKLANATLSSAQLWSLTRTAALHKSVSAPFDALQRVQNPGLSDKLGDRLTALDVAKAVASSISASSMATSDARAVTLRARRKASLVDDLSLFGFILKCGYDVGLQSAFSVAVDELMRLMRPIEKAETDRVSFESFLSNPYLMMTRFLNLFISATSSAARSGAQFWSPFDTSSAAQKQTLDSSNGQFVHTFVQELRRASANAEHALAMAAMRSEFATLTASLTGGGGGARGGGGGGGHVGGGGGKKPVPGPHGATYSFQDFAKLGGVFMAPLNVGVYQVTADGDTVPMVRCVAHERGMHGKCSFVSPATLVGSPDFTCASVNPGRQLVSIPGTRQKRGVSLPTTLLCCVDTAGVHYLHSFH